jgi:ATP-dependent Clp protease adaptor protein ClpS
MKSATAVLEAPEVDTQDPEQKPKIQPPYAVVVVNDDEHTFNYVIETFRKVFKYAVEKCFQLAEEIHIKGRAIVWSGSLEVAELKRDQIISAGTDFYAAKPVTYPLRVELEPME